VDCVNDPSPDLVRHASRRLGVILGAYTVYLDLWLCDLKGQVIANGRPDRYNVAGLDVSREPWFSQAIGLASGDDFAVSDIATCGALKDAQVATYAASVRSAGESRGAPLGVLAIHFDWAPQAAAIVQGVRIAPGDRERTTVMLINASHRIIASSDPRHRLKDQFPISTSNRMHGFYGRGDGATVAFHATPGYETYRGLGWYGVILQASENSGG
jgi:hypothetical protein